MTALWRVLVWTVGSLSVAVLLREGFHLKAPAVAPVLDAYDGALTFVLAFAKPTVTLLLPPLQVALDAGATLKPHWTHVFVIALLQMAPRLNTTFGVGGLQAGALWCFQLFGAIFMAAFAAAYIGAAPFAQPVASEGIALAVFVATALCISFIANFRESSMSEQEERERSETEARWRDRSMIIGGATIAFVLALLGVGMIAVIFGWVDRASAGAALAGLLVLWFLAIIVRWIYSGVAAPRDEIDDWLETSSLTYLLPLAGMLIVVCVLADQLSPRFVIGPMVIMIFVVAAPISLAWLAARNAVGRLVGRDNDTYDARATPALGVFILLGSALFVLGAVAS